VQNSGFGIPQIKGLASSLCGKQLHSSNSNGGLEQVLPKIHPKSPLLTWYNVNIWGKTGAYCQARVIKDCIRGLWNQWPLLCYNTRKYATITYITLSSQGLSKTKSLRKQIWYLHQRSTIAIQAHRPRRAMIPAPRSMQQFAYAILNVDAFCILELKRNSWASSSTRPV